MSYCRFGWDGSDVYIYGTVVDGVNMLDCCGCRLSFEPNPAWDVWRETNPEGKLTDPDAPGMFTNNGKPYMFATYQGMLDHIAEHRAAGHFVPEYVDEELKTEMQLPNDHHHHWVPND